MAAEVEMVARLEPPADLRAALASYERIVVAFSGGKDSMACLLRLFDEGVPADKIELWHHAVDGHGERLMDWPVTESYCRAVAAAFNLPIRFSWREGGFLREMLRNQAPTAPVRFELGDGSIGSSGGKGPPGTRLQFPQVSADLSVRWCSAYLKIDVAASALRNDPRFASGRFLVVTGERRQESAARAKYNEWEVHRSASRKREIHQWRAVIDWSEADVWDAMRRYRVQPHPAYRLGFGRVSCMACIFGRADQWATVRDLAPSVFDKLAKLERDSGKTIHRKLSIVDQADVGASYAKDAPEALRRLSQGERYDDAVIVDDWQMPSGAFKECGGPT